MLDFFFEMGICPFSPNYIVIRAILFSFINNNTFVINFYYMSIIISVIMKNTLFLNRA